MAYYDMVICSILIQLDLTISLAVEYVHQFAGHCGKPDVWKTIFTTVRNGSWKDRDTVPSFWVVNRALLMLLVPSCSMRISCWPLYTSYQMNKKRCQTNQVDKPRNNRAKNARMWQSTGVHATFLQRVHQVWDIAKLSTLVW